MLLPLHDTARLQLIMYPLIDLSTRTVVWRNDECAAGRPSILPHNRRNTFIVSSYWSARLEMCQWRRETLDKVKGLDFPYQLEG
jgi:hypothetical protein